MSLKLNGYGFISVGGVYPRLVRAKERTFLGAGSINGYMDRQQGWVDLLGVCSGIALEELGLINVPKKH